MKCQFEMLKSTSYFKTIGLLGLLALGSLSVPAQSPNPTEDIEPTAKAADEVTAIFNHPEDSRFWLSGQINFVLQWHPQFRARYSGENSLRAPGENATSRVLSLYTGLRVARNTELFCDIESAGGRGISDAFGLAGVTDLDVGRKPTLRATPSLAPLEVRPILSLRSEGLCAPRRPPP